MFHTLEFGLRETLTMNQPRSNHLHQKFFAKAGFATKNQKKSVMCYIYISLQIWSIHHQLLNKCLFLLWCSKKNVFMNWENLMHPSACIEFQLPKEFQDFQVKVQSRVCGIFFRANRTSSAFSIKYNRVTQFIKRNRVKNQLHLITSAHTMSTYCLHKISS
jgi:hypothetical protein